MTIRGLGVVLSSISAFLSLRVFLSSDPSNVSTYIGFVGFLAFLPLAQLGFGRPCYSEVRSRLIDGTLGPHLVSSFISLFLFQVFIGLFLFTILSIALGLTQGYAGRWFNLIVFTVGITSLAVCNFQRDLSYALDKEDTYESLETGRRVVLVLVYLGIGHGFSIQLMGLIAFVAGLGSYLFLDRILMQRIHTSHVNQAAQKRVDHWLQLQPSIGRKARRYFGFSLNEVLLYNTPLIMFTAYPMPENVIFFGVWSKLFLLVVLPARIFIDTRMNHVTAQFFSGNYSEVWRALACCLMVGIGFAFPSLVFFFIFQESLLLWLNAQHILGDFCVWLSLGLWGLGNVVQHTYGAFTVSYQGGFGTAFTISLISLTLVSSTLIFVYLFTLNLGQALAWAGGAYIISALLYSRHVYQLTRSNRVGLSGL